MYSCADLYLAYNSEQRKMRCECYSVVVRNEALEEKYEGMFKGFILKHRGRCNRDITVTCDMGSEVDGIIEDLVDNGLTYGDDFTVFDIWGDLLAASFGKEELVEGHAIETGVKWLKGQYFKGGYYVCYVEG